MKPEPRRLLDLAGRIDAGRPVDWDREERDVGDGEQRRIVNGLRLLAEVAEVLRTSGAEVPPVVARPIEAPASAGTPWGELTVFEIVGRGSFGTVYRATDSLQRTVALKLLDPGRDVAALKARILAEGRLLARVRHPNIVVVHGAGESDGRVGLWMEFVDGRTLAAQVEAQGPLGADEAVLIGRTLCATLAAIHAEGFVHADVKAQNVMRQLGGRLLLMDFGAGEAVTGTDSTRLAGTPLYLSPERLAGGPVAPACDIYALGVLLYFLATGAHPVEGDTREALERAHRDGRRVRLRDRRSDLPDGFVTAVEDAIAADPARRPATMGEFDAALARAASPGPRPDSSEPWPAPVAPPRPPAPSRWSWWVPMLVPAALLLATIVAIYWPEGTPIVRSVPQPAADPSGVGPAAADVYTVRAAFLVLTPQGPRRLAAGEVVRPEDSLELEITLSKPANVFVVNEDDTGAPTVLFPLAGAALRNPLPSGHSLMLPGTVNGRITQWQVSSAGGRERLFVMTSPKSEPGIETAIARLTPAAESGELAARVDRPSGGLRGVRQLSHRETPRPDADAPWRRLARPLSPAAETAQGLWVRELTLENPAGVTPNRRP